MKLVKSSSLGSRSRSLSESRKTKPSASLGGCLPSKATGESFGYRLTVSVDTSAAFRQLVLKPQRLTTELHVSKQLVQQAQDRSVLKLLQDSIVRGLATLLDQLALEPVTA